MHYDPTFNGCEEMTGWNVTESMNDSPIVLVDRGNCSFVTKARNIQKIGGQIALIINHEQNFKDILAISDDGSGSDVEITAILIPEKEGEVIKNFFNRNKDNHNILKEVNILVDNKYENIQLKVPVELFFNAMDHKIYDMIEIIRDDVIETNKISFIPIYTFDLSFETPEYVKYLKEKGRCMCGSRYCEDYDLFEGTGRNILIESIRQKCIFLKAFNGKNTKSLYFDYMSRFNKECRVMDMTISCSDRILKEINPRLPIEIYECSMLSFKYKGCKYF